MSQEPEGLWKGSLSSRCSSQVNAWKQAARETQAFKMEGSVSRATVAATEGKAASVPHAGLMALEHSADADSPLHGSIFCQASGSCSHSTMEYLPPLHQWVLLVTGDFLGFAMCSSPFTILPTQDNTPHPTALPQASMSCPVPSLFAKLLPQLPTD